MIPDAAGDATKARAGAISEEHKPILPARKPVSGVSGGIRLLSCYLRASSAFLCPRDACTSIPGVSAPYRTPSLDWARQLKDEVIQDIATSARAICLRELRFGGFGRQAYLVDPGVFCEARVRNWLAVITIET